MSDISTIPFTTMAVQETPSFSPVAGGIGFGSTVAISSAGAEHIYYTVNGTDPGTAVGGSTLEYTAPITVNSAMTIKAIATRTNYVNSEIGSASYTQGETSNLTNILLSGTPSNYTFAGTSYSYTGVTVANGVESITVTPTGAGTITVDGETVSSGASSSAISLTAGVEKTITVVAAETGKTAKTYIIKVTRQVSSSPGSGGGSSTTTEPSKDGTKVIVNGTEHNVGTETKTTENGKSTVTVKLDNNTIETKIDDAVKNNQIGTNNILQVPISDTKSEVTRVELTGDIVKKLEVRNFDISVKRENIEYVISAEELTISKLAQNFELEEKDLKDIKVEVEIIKLDEKEIVKYNEIAKENGATIVFPPVSFEITAKIIKSDGKTGTIEIDKFNNYVERIIEIPAGVDENKITTGIVFNSDGTYNHVPTEVFKKDGKMYAKLNSLTNSKYSVVWNPVTVKSVENHWAKNSVNNMASRLIVFNTESFEPNKAVTRADFAEYIVRALGIYREGVSYENKFNDVSKAGDRTLAILTASEYGIVMGYTDGTFKPDALITREEAMAIYQRAMNITKLVGSDTNRYQSYTDFDKVSGWAASSVKDVLAAHVFNGTSETSISPRANLAYAEAVQAIKNLLEESNLINK